MKWHDWWPYARTGWGWTVAVATVGFAVYRGPKFVLETWDWYLDRFFDSKVRAVLEANFSPPFSMHGPRKYGKPVAVAAIVEATKMSEKRVRACLRRLQRRKQAEQVGEKDEWKMPNQ